MNGYSHSGSGNGAFGYGASDESDTTDSLSYWASRMIGYASLAAGVMVGVGALFIF